METQIGPQTQAPVARCGLVASGTSLPAAAAEVMVRQGQSRAAVTPPGQRKPPKSFKKQVPPGLRWRVRHRRCESIRANKLFHSFLVAHQPEEFLGLAHASAGPQTPQPRAAKARANGRAPRMAQEAGKYLRSGPHGKAEQHSALPMKKEPTLLQID